MPNKPQVFSRPNLLVVAVAGVALVGGCVSQNPAVKRSEQAVDVLVDSRQSLVVEEQSVADAQTALKTLRESKGDLQPSFQAFTAQLNAVKRQAQRLQRESEQVKAQSTLYCTARQNDISTISNEDLRKTAEQRTAHMREQCNTINERYAQVNANFARYLASLNDLQTYLANELNYATLDSSKKWVDEALTNGERLRGDIRDLALQVDLTSNILSPIPIATTQWPTSTPSADALAGQP